MLKPDLDNAYSLNGPDDAKRLYADWAETYDQEFAGAMDFIVPDRVAAAYLSADGRGPVLDFGCGTGLAGVALARLAVGPIDGADLSSEMLDVARRKGVYRDLIAGDVMARLDIPNGSYQGIISSGTFTHGHVGPDALNELLRIAAPGAQFALSINGAHFEAAGFRAKFRDLKAQISPPQLPEVRFYGDAATGPHKNDTGRIAIFRKL